MFERKFPPWGLGWRPWGWTTPVGVKVRCTSAIRVSIVFFISQKIFQFVITKSPLERGCNAHQHHGMSFIHWIFIISGLSPRIFLTFCMFMQCLCVFMHFYRWKILKNRSARETPPHPNLYIPHARWGNRLRRDRLPNRWSDSKPYYSTNYLSIFSTHPNSVVTGWVGMWWYYAHKEHYRNTCWMQRNVEISTISAFPRSLWLALYRQ